MYKEKIIDVLTGEETLRDYTATEIAELEAIKAQREALQVQADVEQAAKDAARQAILDRIGLTADEATLLLGGN
jgi:hypothetical protein